MASCIQNDYCTCIQGYTPSSFETKNIAHYAWPKLGYENMKDNSYFLISPCFHLNWNKKYGWFGLVRFMMLTATFNNISVISWRSVLLVEEPGVPGENHWPAINLVTDKLYHLMLYRLSGIRTLNISGDRYWFHR